MRKIDSLDIPAGTAVELKPGGYHVMLIGLVKPLVAGSNVELTLTFEKAGDVKVTVPVRDDAP
ncbi:MAG TPA: copper chaperone PCu(A)C [Ilumatobacteraceae bacterium]|nr:copper chaperone PCu(A)C [Ilumatobacteraceae bacterium]